MNYFERYHTWASRGDPDEVSGLEEEDFEMICDIIEDLFERICCQKSRLTNLAELGQSIKELGGVLRKDVDGFSKRKRMATRSIEGHSSLLKIFSILEVFS